jgi:hypothetical protein
MWQEDKKNKNVTHETAKQQHKENLNLTHCKQNSSIYITKTPDLANKIFIFKLTYEF